MGAGTQLSVACQGVEAFSSLWVCFLFKPKGGSLCLVICKWQMLKVSEGQPAVLNKLKSQKQIAKANGHSVEGAISPVVTWPLADLISLA